MTEGSEQNTFFIEPFSINVRLSIGKFIEEIKILVVEKQMFKNWKKNRGKLHLLNKLHFLKFLDCEDSDDRNKHDASPLKQFTSTGKHATETWIRFLSLYSSRKISFKN